MRMSLMNALVETYDYAFGKGLVDNHRFSNDGLIILPLYHSSKRASSNEDIFEIRIDKKGEAIGGRFLDKDEIVVYPITEDSIKRSGRAIAPHALADELSYLSRHIDEKKNEVFIEGIEKLMVFEKENPCLEARILVNYLSKNMIFEDFINFHCQGCSYKLEGNKLVYDYEDEKGKKKKELVLNKIFISFKIVDPDGADISLSQSREIHDFYIKYIEEENKAKVNDYCDISGKLTYCVDRHRGIVGTSKLIGVSNRPEVYAGRIKNGNEVYHVGYDTSQKALNMLKYLIDNKNHSQYLGEGAYLINWLAEEVDKGGFDLFAEFDDEVEDDSLADLGGSLSKKLSEFFIGENSNFKAASDFYTLIIEQINDGRISVKYFRQFKRSEACERIKNWYDSMNWQLYSYSKKAYIYRSPSLYELANFLYGQENKQGFLVCDNKKLARNLAERILPSITEGRKIPLDIARIAFHKSSKRRSYDSSWNIVMNLTCAIVKKYKYDYEGYLIESENLMEVEALQKSRSFQYGRLMATYEKLEMDAVGARDGDEKGRGKLTNMDRLWSSFISSPSRAIMLMETSKIKTYKNMLKRNNISRYIYYEKILLEVMEEIRKLEEENPNDKGRLNQDYILGYYGQKRDFYSNKDEKNN